MIRNKFRRTIIHPLQMSWINLCNHPFILLFYVPMTKYFKLSYESKTPSLVVSHGPNAYTCPVFGTRSASVIKYVWNKSYLRDLVRTNIKEPVSTINCSYKTKQTIEIILYPVFKQDPVFTQLLIESWNVPVLLCIFQFIVLYKIFSPYSNRQPRS